MKSTGGGPHPEDLREESRRIRILRFMTDVTHQRLCIERMTLSEALEAVEELKYFYLPERRRQLFNRLASGTREIPDAQPAGTVVNFGAIVTSPTGGNLDEQYIELINPNGFAVDISGWTVSIGQDMEIPIFTFRGGTVIPANSVIYVATDRVAFRSRSTYPTGGQALFVVGDFSGRLAARGETLHLTDRQQVTVSSATTPQTGR